MTLQDYAKPLPIITALNGDYWEMAKRHELGLQRCQQCHRFWYPASDVCPSCWSREYVWTAVSGRGKVASWVVFHRLYFDGFADELPYSVVLVELEEGPRLISNLTNIATDDIVIDMPVEVWFDDVTPEVTLPKFRPAGSS